MTELENLQDVREQVKGIRTVMFTTTDPSGRVTSRPMTVQKFADDGIVWFIVDRSADWVDTSVTEAVNVAFVDGEKSWVSVSGTARYKRDQAILDELWDSVTDAYYPEGGSESEDAWLIEVTPDRVDWWTNPSTLKFFYEVAKAQITDERPEEGAAGTIEI